MMLPSCCLSDLICGTGDGLGRCPRGGVSPLCSPRSLPQLGWGRSAWGPRGVPALKHAAPHLHQGEGQALVVLGHTDGRDDPGSPHAARCRHPVPGVQGMRPPQPGDPH